uniref:Uncharacterized protein n=1 Tax=Anguilla anguilla TaxID=7936 RepID=A0A0E9Q3W7_ANGAN
MTLCTLADPLLQTDRMQEDHRVCLFMVGTLKS